jgi:hypothetical protein
MQLIVDFLGQPFWLIAGKLVLCTIMLLMSFCGFYILFRFQELHDALANMEMNAMRSRDDAMFQFTAVRSRLADLRERGQAPDDDTQAAIVKGATAAVMLLLRRERGMLQWGMLGLKVARSAWAHFKQK